MARRIRKHALIGRWLIALGIAAATYVIVFHAIAPWWLLERLNARLDRMAEHRGAFEGVSIQWWRGAVRLQGLSIRANDAPAALPPLLDIPTVDTSLTAFFSDATPIRAELTALHPVKTLIADAEGRLVQFGFGEDWVQLLQDLVPLPIQQLRVERGVVRVFAGTDAETADVLHVSRLDGTIDRKGNDAGVMARFDGRLPGSGSIRFSAESASAKLTQASRLRLDLREVSLPHYKHAIESVTGIRVSNGRLQADLALHIREGGATGQIDSTLSRLRFGEAFQDAPIDWIGETILEAGVALIGDGEHETFSVEIPLKGHVQPLDQRTLQGMLELTRQLVASPLEWDIEAASSQ
ncbi:MAG: AsmA family protein [Algiphilus sp.]